jgi:hypothetical protein
MRSGHGVGKTFTVAALAEWWLQTREDAIVLTTAPTWRQVESITWATLRRLHRASRKTLAGDLLNTSLKISDSRFALGLSTDEPERFQGYHSPNIMVIEDESPGVAPAIHEAIEGVLSGGGKWIKVGNPTSPSGHFYEAFRSPGWHPIVYSCWEHPNVTEGRTIVPGAVTREWCEARLAEWGEEHPLYQARVLGEFPQEGEDTLIRLSWAEAAINRDLPSGDPTVLACDVARFGGDETVIGIRRGPVYREVERYRGKDLMQTCGMIVRAIGAEKPATVVVDDDGLGGGVVDRLRELGHEVVAFRGGEKAIRAEAYYNRRSEAWHGLRDHLRDGAVSIQGSERDGILAQLTGIKWEMTSKGLLKLEGKDDMKKRGIRSPDRADTMAMAYAPILPGPGVW